MEQVLYKFLVHPFLCLLGKLAASSNSLPMAGKFLLIPDLSHGYSLLSELDWFATRIPVRDQCLRAVLYKILHTSHVDPDCNFSHREDSSSASWDITEAGIRIGRADHSLIGQEISIPYLEQGAVSYTASLTLDPSTWRDYRRLETEEREREKLIVEATHTHLEHTV